MKKPRAVLALELAHVNKRFGDKQAIKDISIEVKTGEIFGFLGPNGAGKSTTIRLILDILRADSGTITLLGESNRRTSMTHRKIGFLSGDMALDTDLTGEQYLEFINYSFGGGHEAYMRELAHKLDAKLDVRIGTYSRGNKQKIGLIGALMHRPELLILDEPTSGFDPLIQDVFASLMKNFKAAGGTVFMSSHILNEVQQLCDRVAFIRDGEIVDTKTIEQLTTTTSKRIRVGGTKAQLDDIRAGYKKVKGLQLLPDKTGGINLSYSGDPKPLLSFFSTFTISDITIREPELEEIFSHYYEVGRKET